MAQSDEPRRGTVLAGKYELHSVLGKGGMGVVFRGKHLGTDRPIAVKVLRRELTSDPTLAKRFMREAKAAAVIQHPNVVDVLDYGVDGDGTAYQVLELLEGESLGEHLVRKGTVPIDVALSLMLPVIHALAVAHARGVVHRDLKPDNVFLARNAHGRIVPKLLDFGIAKLMPKDGSTTSTLATRAGSAIGTPAYMSPEQARGTGDVGTATDVWAVGVLLFECVAGRLPFEAETGSILMARIIMEQAPSLGSVAPGTPPAIVGAIDRALASSQDERWPTMAAFAQALRDAAAASEITVPPLGASDASPMSLPPPRSESDVETVASPISSGDDWAGHPATGPKRPATAVTQPEIASARDAARAEPIEETPPAPPSRVPMGLVLAVSIGVAALVLLGLWMREPVAEVVAPNAPIVEIAEPPRLAQPPTTAPAPTVPVEVAPTVETPAQVPVVIEEIAPVAVVPAPHERPRRTPPARAPSAETTTTTHTTTPNPEPGSRLPELTGW